MRVTNSRLGSLKAGYKKFANSGLNETITAKLHMNSNSGTMPQTGIAGYSESYSGRFKTLICCRISLYIQHAALRKTRCFLFHIDTYLSEGEVALWPFGVQKSYACLPNERRRSQFSFQ